MVSPEVLCVSVHGSVIKAGTLVDLYDHNAGRVVSGLVLRLKLSPRTKKVEFHHNYVVADVQMAGRTAIFQVPVDFLRKSYPYFGLLPQEEQDLYGSYRNHVVRLGDNSISLRVKQQDIVSGKATQELPGEVPWQDHKAVPWYVAALALESVIEDQERTERGIDLVR